MDDRIQVLSIVGAAGLLLLVLELVRRRALLERYALLWLFSALGLLVFAIWRDGLVVLADAVGIASPPNALFTLAFGAILVLLLHFSVAVSRMADRSKLLTQRVALMDEQLRRLRERSGASPDDDTTEQDEELDPVSMR